MAAIQRKVRKAAESLDKKSSVKRNPNPKPVGEESIKEIDEKT